MRCVWAVVILLVAVCFCNAASAQPEGKFVEGPCPGFDHPRVRCGAVSVADGTGAKAAFSIAVAIVSAQEPVRGAEPVVILHGGPGAAIVEDPRPWLNAPIGRHRDLVLIDQRGGGLSTPSVCPELIGQRVDLMAADLRGSELLAAMTAADEACLNGLLRTAWGPDAFGTAEIVSDIDHVRRALRIERWNVYGVSYGTTVAMTMMAKTPETIRSVILDSPYPPDGAPISETGNFARSLQRFYAACRDDADCAARFPDLEDRFLSTVRMLADQPLTINMQRGQFTQEGFVLNDGDFLMIVFQMLYSRDAAGILPHFIESVHERRADRLAPLTESMFTRMLKFSFGAHLAIECRDRPRLRNDPAPLPAGVPAELDAFNFFEGHYAVCPGWGELGEGPLLPEGSQIPTLVLSGDLDPITPPSFARQVAAALPRAQLLDLPFVGHGVARSSPCAGEIAAAFLDDLTEDLDRACLEDLPPVPFASDIAYLPRLSRGLDVASQGGLPLWPLAVAVSGLAAFLWLIMCAAAALWASVRRKPPARSPAPGGRAILAANLLAVMHISILAGLTVRTLTESPAVVAFGLSGEARLLFVLTWIIAGLALWGAIQAIRARRLTGLAALPAIVFSVSMTAVGLAGV